MFLAAACSRAPDAHRRRRRSAGRSSRRSWRRRSRRPRRALRTNDDDTYTLRVMQRIARRTGGAIETDVPGIVFLEIDGLALPGAPARDARRAARRAGALARERRARLAEWETDLSSQTGASQAGHPARLERGHPGVPLGREGDGPRDGVLGARRLRGDRAARTRPASGCCATAARAAATCSPARRTT